MIGYFGFDDYDFADIAEKNRLSTLYRADLADIGAAQRRYAGIATTLDDALTKLAMIVDGGSEGLRGEYVGPLKEKAGEIRDDLAKAAVRYEDVATEIAKYEPDLEHAQTEVAAALDDRTEAVHAVTRANSMPGPVPDPDGTITPEEQQKAADRQRAQDEAQSQVNQAKNRLTAALDALDVAGKRFGDAVNCKQYKDGLSDGWKDRMHEAFEWISGIFGALAMVITGLALLIPGLNVLVIGGLIAGGIALIADSVLYAAGEAGVEDVILGVVGLALGGAGLAFAKFGSKIFESVKGVFQVLKNPGFFKGLGSTGKIFPAARPGFFASDGKNFWAGWDMWKDLFKTRDFGKFARLWWEGTIGRNFFAESAQLLGRSASLADGVWLAWMIPNILFSLGAGLGFAGHQQKEGWG
ncbi:hypothetical protein GCM10012284_32550 [Mangrovihabitans endophyticus]|uniref:Uncharacterized protein n=2 Tax=Mangrovihabitans endophyticus TaxID=1751298 RepID=A0A8J3C1Q6_9ACTN|nr:hypothetical protein GCM10012284_32550 [Mangrovihabitans endophyticus]